MSEPTTTPARKKRAKATTPLGRSILQRERQRIAKEQAKLGEDLAKAARQRMADDARMKRVHTPETSAVSRGVVRRIAAVLASENVTVPIHCSPTQGHFEAWTDFEKIHVDYHLHDDVRLTAAIMRGMLYHEGGHCRFTITWPELRKMAEREYKEERGPEANLPVHPSGVSEMQRAWNVLEDQRMETAVTSDSPRKALYFTPMVMAELMKDVNTAAANWPVLVWRRYLPKHLRDTARSYWVQQNDEAKAIEVEEAVNAYVTADTALDMYLAVLKATELLKGSPAIAGHFGSSHQYQYRYDADEEETRDKLVIPIDPSTLDEETLREMIERMEEEARKNEQAQDDASETPVSQDNDEADASNDSDEWLDDEPEVVYELPILDLDAEPQKRSGGSPTPSKDEAGEDEDDEAGESEGIRGTGDIDEPTQGEGAGGDTGDSDAAGDDGDTNPTNEGGSSEGASSGGSHDGDFDQEAFDRQQAAQAAEAFQQDLDEAIEEAESERYQDKALDGDMQAYEQARWETDSKLLPYVPGVETNNDLMAVADTLAYEIEQAFEANTMDRAPAWVEQQNRGVVNVIRYETRQVTDNNFYRQWQDDDQPGFNIAVSVLLDYSTSMDNQTSKLAQAGFASKAACDRLGIPCTVVLWDTDARTLWDAQETAVEMPRINCTGGTDPSIALSDLDAHRMEKQKHLVLIFTDGDWTGEWANGTRSLYPYQSEGRYMIGFIMGRQYLADRIKDWGADETHVIDDLLEIPRRLETALVDMA